MEIEGEIYRVSGPVVTATGIKPRMYDVVFVGHERLMGEVMLERGTGWKLIMIALQGLGVADHVLSARRALSRNSENVG